MRATIAPSTLRGAIPAVASKSMAHRLLILARLSGSDCSTLLSASSQDIEATRRCLDAICVGGHEPLALDCGESGSTLRFLLPVACAMGVKARFYCFGRLLERPLAPLDEQLRAHGAEVRKATGAWEVSGRATGGRFVLPGDVSSQYVSGLLLAAPFMDSACEILVSTPVQSRPYIDLTIGALTQFGIDVTCQKTVLDGLPYEQFCTHPNKLVPKEGLTVEGDWSNAAFWLAAGSMEQEGITVTGLNLSSAQGDRAILAALSMLGARIARKGGAARATHDSSRPMELDVSSIPDLVPPLAAVAATTPGTTRLKNAGRLRLKESNRLESVCNAICAMGGQAHILDDSLVISGVDQLEGGEVDPCNDHRIAMMAAVMATHARSRTTVLDAECVAKSYPAFWDDYRSLGGIAILD